MDDETLKIIVGNEKEWRMYMVRTMEHIRTAGITNSKDISALKTWNMVWRFLYFSSFSFLLYGLKGIIFK